MKTRILVFLAVLSVAGPAIAQHEGQTPELIPLEEILDGVAAREGLTFTLMPQAAASISVWQLDPDEITFAQLHTLLANYGLAAVAVEDVINIIPNGVVRQYPLPILTEPDDSMADDQWVTWIIRTERANASMMVPIIRPILPQQGHLVAHPDSGTILIVDRYANAVRVVELIRDIDENSPRARD